MITAKTQMDFTMLIVVQPNFNSNGIGKEIPDIQNQQINSAGEASNFNTFINFRPPKHCWLMAIW